MAYSQSSHPSYPVGGQFHWATAWAGTQAILWEANLLGDCLGRHPYQAGYWNHRELKLPPTRVSQPQESPSHKKLPATRSFQPQEASSHKKLPATRSFQPQLGLLANSLAILIPEQPPKPTCGRPVHWLIARVATQAILWEANLLGDCLGRHLGYLVGGQFIGRLLGQPLKLSCGRPISLGDCLSRHLGYPVGGQFYWAIAWAGTRA